MFLPLTLTAPDPCGRPGLLFQLGSVGCRGSAFLTDPEYTGRADAPSVRSATKQLLGSEALGLPHGLCLVHPVLCSPQHCWDLAQGLSGVPSPLRPSALDPTCLHLVAREGRRTPGMFPRVLAFRRPRPLRCSQLAVFGGARLGVPNGQGLDQTSACSKFRLSCVWGGTRMPRGPPSELPPGVLQVSPR